jgi:predicted amidohydrolase
MNLTSLRVASVQMECVAGDKAANFVKIEHFASEAAERGARLVLFPECCITGYWFIRNLSVDQLAALAEPVPTGPSVQRLIALAQRLGLSIGAGLVEDAGDGVFHNTYVVTLPEGTLHRHRKLHAFEHSVIRGGEEFTVFDLPEGWRCGLLICYDCNIIENVRINALRGVDVLLAPHQTGGVRSKNPHLMGLIDRRLWENRRVDPEAIERELGGDKGRGWLMRWLPSRAHDNGLFLVFSNGVGIDDDEIRTGNAMILDPYGRILAETCVAADAMVVADLNPALFENCTGRKWLRARRPALYTSLTVPTGNECDVRKLKFEE